uniref:Uncharacterized protein n=1 Tax=Chelonoidis abingdonii TaxID=106734 RepID=A0A8C0G8G7_CHEAB
IVDKLFLVTFTKSSETQAPSVFAESVDYGPVFVQEPDDVIFPTDSEEKKVSLNCQARGNPAPIYRYSEFIGNFLQLSECLASMLSF